MMLKFWNGASQTRLWDYIFLHSLWLVQYMMEHTFQPISRYLSWNFIFQPDDTFFSQVKGNPAGTVEISASIRHWIKVDILTLIFQCFFNVFTRLNKYRWNIDVNLTSNVEISMPIWHQNIVIIFNAFLSVRRVKIVRWVVTYAWNLSNDAQVVFRYHYLIIIFKIRFEMF